MFAPLAVAICWLLLAVGYADANPRTPRAASPKARRTNKAPRRSARRSTPTVRWAPAYRDRHGRIVPGVRVAADRQITRPEAKSSASYLAFAIRALRQAGYNVGVQTASYRDTTTGRLSKGSIVVDHSNPHKFYHVIINGSLPNYRHGEDSPLLRQPTAGDRIKILRHDRNMPPIDSPEFRLEDGSPVPD